MIRGGDNKVQVHSTQKEASFMIKFVMLFAYAAINIVTQLNAFRPELSPNTCQDYGFSVGVLKTTI